MKGVQAFGYKHDRWRVFQDFTIMASIALCQQGWWRDEQEARYMQVVGTYTPEEAQRFSELLGEVVMGLQVQPCDFLGECYMELELGSKEQGQFFTPYHLGLLLAQISLGDKLESEIADKGFISVSDPAAGAGCMLIATIQAMRDRGIDPCKAAWFHAVDVSETAARMCYIQLSLLDVPALVYIGNSLSMEMREVMPTYAFLAGNWGVKTWANREPGHVGDRAVDVIAPTPTVVVPDAAQFELFSEGAA